MYNIKCTISTFLARTTSTVGTSPYACRKAKVKFTLEQATMDHRRSRGTDLILL
jgi:hypothetical protein